jgi:hypothetical protein
LTSGLNDDSVSTGTLTSKTRHDPIINSKAGIGNAVVIPNKTKRLITLCPCSTKSNQSCRYKMTLSPFWPA